MLEDKQELIKEIMKYNPSPLYNSETLIFLGADQDWDKDLLQIMGLDYLIDLLNELKLSDEKRQTKDY